MQTNLELARIYGQRAEVAARLNNQPLAYTALLAQEKHIEMVISEMAEPSASSFSAMLSHLKSGHRAKRQGWSESISFMAGDTLYIGSDQGPYTVTLEDLNATDWELLE